MCIITVVKAQQNHKGMFLKHEGGGGGQNFSYSVTGGGGGGSPIDFAKPSAHPWL